MTDLEYIKQISKMSVYELLGEIMENPQYLTDPYYADIGRAMRERYTELSSTWLDF